MEVVGILVLVACVAAMLVQERRIKQKEKEIEVLKREVDFQVNKVIKLQDPYFILSAINPPKIKRKDYIFQSIGLSCKSCGQDAKITRKEIVEKVLDRKAELANGKIKVEFRQTIEGE